MHNTYQLTLSKEIYDQILDHAKSLSPIESCGYLAGKEDIVNTFYPMTNIDNSPEHFSFDPKEQFKVMKEARNEQNKLIAVYHSHPASKARLSAEDLKLFNDPEPVYLIMSLKEEKEELKGFKVFKPDDKTIEVYDVKLNIEENKK